MDRFILVLCLISHFAGFAHELFVRLSAQITMTLSNGQASAIHVCPSRACECACRLADRSYFQIEFALVGHHWPLAEEAPQPESKLLEQPEQASLTHEKHVFLAPDDTPNILFGVDCFKQ